VNCVSHSLSVSSVGGRAGYPTAVCGIPSEFDHGEGVAVDSGVGSVLIPCSCQSDVDVADGLIHLKKKSTPYLSDLANSLVVCDGI
jgi:hypothetical protein